MSKNHSIGCVQREERRRTGLRSTVSSLLYPREEDYGKMKMKMKMTFSRAPFTNPHFMFSTPANCSKSFLRRVAIILSLSRYLSISLSLYLGIYDSIFLLQDTD